MNTVVTIKGVGDFLVTSASVEEAQNEVGKINFSIPAQDIPDPEMFYFHDIVLTCGDYVKSGILIEQPVPKVENGYVVYSFSAYTDIGRLTCYRAFTDAHYQDILVALIVNSLVHLTPDWVLTDISTMPDQAAVTTIDLRSGNETTFAQIAAAVKSIPQMYLRYGGYNSITQKHQLHIGSFGAKRWYATEGDNLISIDSALTVRRTINRIEAYSDKSGDTRVTLGDALAYPGLTSSIYYARYPITVEGGKYIVRDASLPAGCSISKSYSIHKTKNDSEPTNENINQTGFAVWQAAVRDLQKNVPHRTYTVTATLDEWPTLSDMIYLRSQVDELTFDPVAQRERLVRTFSVDDWYRIVNIKTDFSMADGDKLVFTITATDQPDAEDTDPEVELFNKLVPRNTADKNTLTSGSGIKGSQIVSVTYTPSINPADGACGGTAKEYTFALPALPPGTSGIIGYISSQSPSTATYSITQQPVYPATPLVACVHSPGGGWSGSTAITITVIYIFY